MESSINSQIRINTTQNQILSMNCSNISNLNNQHMEHSYSSNRINHLSLQFNTLHQTESPQKRVRTLKSLRIREQEVILQWISKSFELKNVRNQKKQQRRKSGIEHLSQKQLHIDYQYPNTIVQQQELKANELQRTKERKRTIFKRMSSILIKHQTTIRNINNQENQRNNEIQLLMLQDQQQCHDKHNITQSQEIKKNKFRSSIIEFEKSKVVLSISRKSKKPFASIQSYISEKTLTQTINQTNPFINYVQCQSLTEMNGQIQNNLNTGRCQVIKPTQPLPEIKLISSARNNYSLLDTNYFKQKKIIINTGNTQRKQRISTNS